jgi:hypothetical protein
VEFFHVIWLFMMILENLEGVQLLVDNLSLDEKPKTVKEIYGDSWTGSHGNKTQRGKKFNEAVLSGKIRGLRRYGDKLPAKYVRTMTPC